jgi:hypothetical protein
MTETHLDTLSALIDGETVDPTALAEALADPQAAATLRQFAACRAELRDDPDRPDEAFYATMQQVLRPSWWRRVGSRGVMAAALATALLLAALTGFAVRPLVSPVPGGGAPARATSAAAQVAPPAAVLDRRPPAPEQAGPTDSRRGLPDTTPPRARPVGFLEWREGE